VCGVGVNPTRTGLLDVLREMGAAILVHNERIEAESRSPTSPSAPLRCTGDSWWEVVVRMIDEFRCWLWRRPRPRGRPIVRDAAELRVKETDRIATVVEELRRLGPGSSRRRMGLSSGDPRTCGGRR